MLRAAVLAAFFTACACSSSAQAVQGRAVVIDGDTLQIDGRQIRLHGIDAPEMGQACHYPDGIPDMCGRGSALVLMALAEGGVVRCEPVAAVVGTGLPTARCRAGDVDLAAALVRQGAAWAIGPGATEYGELERQARAAALGIWGLRSTPPWEHRAALARKASDELASPCVFKAVTARSGERLYFPPWSPWWSAVKVEPRRGDLWHCDEASAAGAGALLPRDLIDSIVSGVYDP